MTKKLTTCTNHCGACGLHLHSVAAFDAHRQGDYASNDPEIGRHCVHPYDLDGKLEVLADDGECRIYEDASQPGSGIGVQRNVTIWTTAGYAEYAQRMRAAKAV